MESPLEEVRERALALAVQFGDERALTTMRQIPSMTNPRRASVKTPCKLCFCNAPPSCPALRSLARRIHRCEARPCVASPSLTIQKRRN